MLQRLIDTYRPGSLPGPHPGFIVHRNVVVRRCPSVTNKQDIREVFSVFVAVSFLVFEFYNYFILMCKPPYHAAECRNA
jgi:hypothetical protein